METLGSLRRTNYCGEVSLSMAGQEMTVCGSIARARDKGGIIFADLRDTTGILQLVFDEDTPKDVFAKAESLKSEYVVICRGKLRERAAKTDKIATGDVELYVSELRILSEAQTTPFELRDEINVNDDLRLRYRYLDLRRPSMHEPIVLRSKIMQIIRNYFCENHFTEIETPTLIKSTPEGARDYLVPSRVQPGHFYALPQSPQLYKQILMLIALSVEHETVDIQCVISPEFIHNVASILSMMSQRYCTPEFDNDYILQFSLHMYYAQQRCAFHISYPNPIALQFKKDYAPVYDMAVYFAHRFAQIYHIEVSEDEIAFIAFHIGSYLENNKQSREHATCVVIVESYHMLARQLIHEINVAFANQIIVKEVLPLNRYLNRQPECDLVLTTLPLGIQHPHVVQISPILTKANCESIRAQLSSISTERELARARQFLQSLLHKELYFRNVSLSDAAAYIHFMGEQCVKHGYAKEEFVQDVLQRESFSSTAFTDVLAVPHAINQYADRSFICVIHNDMPIQWKKKTVHFVLMIGITEAEMKFFKPAFDRIVELFNSTSRTLELLKTNTFEEFCAQMR